MRINVKSLRESGFEFSMDKDAENIYIQADQDNPRARTAIKRLADSMNFNDQETDDVAISVARIATMRAIRIATGGYHIASMLSSIGAFFYLKKVLDTPIQIGHPHTCEGVQMRMILIRIWRQFTTTRPVCQYVHVLIYYLFESGIILSSVRK